jgi:transcriptional regulator with XRE-family HTH domain
MTIDENLDEQLAAWSHRLRVLMTERNRTQRSVERDLGWGTGYLSQLLRADPPDLKVKHFLAILDNLGVSARTFVAGLDRGGRTAGSLGEMSGEEVRGFVARLLREELARLGRDPESTDEGPEEPRPAEPAARKRRADGRRA